MSDRYEQLEARELDALVAERLLGYRWLVARAGCRFLCRPDSILMAECDCAEGTEAVCADGLRYVPHCSSRIGDAWMAVERMRERSDRVYLLLETSAGGDDLHVARFIRYRPDEGDGLLGLASHPEEVPRAICIAALRALDTEARA